MKPSSEPQTEPESAERSEPAPNPNTTGIFGRLCRLSLKELRETLRDRRTIATLVLMPLLVYPLLSIVFQRFLLTNLTSLSPNDYYIAVESEGNGQLLDHWLRVGNRVLEERKRGEPNRATSGNKLKSDNELEPEQPSSWSSSGQESSPPIIRYGIEADLETAVATQAFHVGIRVLRSEPFRRSEMPPPLAIDYEIIYLESSLNSQRVLNFIESRLRAVNEEQLRRRMQRIGRPRRVLPLVTTHRTVPMVGGSAAYSLSALVPLILILMTITGAVYPAIDLTAGERERGTLEILVAAPVPRLGLLLAKYVAVLTIALLTATVNLVSMTVTVLSIGLGPLLFGEKGLSLGIMGQVFGLLILFAAFFSAVLLVLTSFARSFKEAQAYLIPLMLVSIAPGMLSMIPGLRLSGLLSVTPLVNIVLLARDLFEQTAEPLTAVIVIFSTSLYALAAITVAARIFGTDAVLYGSHGTWSDLFRRPVKHLRAASLTNAMLCLGLLFPAQVLLSNVLGQWRDLTISARLMATSVITVVLFSGIPLVAAVTAGIRVTDGFRLKRSRMITYPAAMLLGLSLWPFVFEIVLFTKQMGLFSLDPSLTELAESLVADLQRLPPWQVLLSLAVVPAVFEEFFFRGYLFTALAARMRAFNAILISAVLFGLFHLIVRDALAVERFVPSTLLGLVLGWVCYRTGSVVPGMLLHACNNGIVLLIVYSQETITAWGWGIKEETHLPGGWLVAAAAGTITGLVLIAFSRRKS